MVTPLHTRFELTAVTSVALSTYMGIYGRDTYRDMYGQDTHTHTHIYIYIYTYMGGTRIFIYLYLYIFIHQVRADGRDVRGPVGGAHQQGYPRGPPPGLSPKRVIDNLLVRIHFIIAMIRWTGLAPWGFEFPFPGSLTSVPQHSSTTTRWCMTLSSQVNLPHAIDFRALCGANSVT